MNQETLVYPLADHTILQDRYELLHVLNAGGFGITYMAYDHTTTQHVVIKECMPEAYAFRDLETGAIHPTDETTQRNFELSISNSKQEASVLSQLHHEGIVRVFDMFDAFGTTYYVMERIRGHTLYEIITAQQAEGTSMPPEQVKDLLLRLLNILQYLHSQSVYHCDIKPGNIFIQEDGSPKLIDFGAVRTKKLQHQGLVQITPGYTAPEFYPGRRAELGGWCDIYGLGATFYELLTGKIPQPADQRSVVDRNPKITGIATLRSAYTMKFLAGIDKALSPDERNRFRSATAWIQHISTSDSNGGFKTGPAQEEQAGETPSGDLVQHTSSDADKLRNESIRPTIASLKLQKDKPQAAETVDKLRNESIRPTIASLKLQKDKPQAVETADKPQNESIRPTIASLKLQKDKPQAAETADKPQNESIRPTIASLKLQKDKPQAAETADKPQNESIRPTIASLKLQKDKPQAASPVSLPSSANQRTAIPAVKAPQAQASCQGASPEKKPNEAIHAEAASTTSAKKIPPPLKIILIMVGLMLLGILLGLLTSHL